MTPYPHLHSTPHRRTPLPAVLLLRTVLISISALLLTASCSEEEQPYPDLVTELADMCTDGNGTFIHMTTDNGTRYSILNTNIQPHRPDTTYRAVVGYVAEAVVPTPVSASSPTATAVRIYSLASATVLSDSTTVLRYDPTGIESMWHQGPYINMQLTAKTQGGTHYWGFATDSVHHAGTGNRLHSHHHLSLHHNQGQDPISYSRTYYCSIPLTAIEGYRPGDTVSVTVHTFSGTATWTF